MGTETMTAPLVFIIGCAIAFFGFGVVTGILIERMVWRRAAHSGLGAVVKVCGRIYKVTDLSASP